MQVFILNNSFSQFPYFYTTLCVTIATNLTNGLLINYTRIGSAFNKLSENKYFYFLTLTLTRFLTGYNRILIPDKEWDLLGHILVPNWGVRKG